MRKAKYFRQNTQLGGHVFDYHGDPRAILRGRILALVLFAAYSWAFQFSSTAGLVTVIVLCAAAPWLFLRAQQFALSNTSHRGLRFGFDAKPGHAFRTILPTVVIWLTPTVVFALLTDLEDLRLTLGLPLLTGLCVPWMHHRLKAYQRRHATYGDQAFTFRPCLGSFFSVYLVGAGVLMLAGFAGGLAAVGLGSLLPSKDMVREVPLLYRVLVGGTTALMVFLLSWPYFATRLQKLVWDRTQLGDIRFRTDLSAWPLLRIVWKNAILTIATCGLYWPFGAVALARYRVECLSVRSLVPLASIAVGNSPRAVGAAGDGAADAFGFDIGL